MDLLERDIAAGTKEGLAKLLRGLCRLSPHGGEPPYGGNACNDHDDGFAASLDAAEGRALAGKLISLAQACAADFGDTALSHVPPKYNDYWLAASQLRLVAWALEAYIEDVPEDFKEARSLDAKDVGFICQYQVEALVRRYRLDEFEELEIGNALEQPSAA